MNPLTERQRANAAIAEARHLERRADYLASSTKSGAPRATRKAILGLRQEASALRRLADALVEGVRRQRREGVQ